MPARTCGPCTACCRILSVEEIGKPPDVACRHLSPTRGAPPRAAAGVRVPTGCGIYPKRPKSCRAFSCLWLEQDRIQDELRPDRLGVVMRYGWHHENPQTKEPAPPPCLRPLDAARSASGVGSAKGGWHGLIVWVDKDRPDAWRQPEVFAIIAAVQEACGHHLNVAFLGNAPATKAGVEAMIAEQEAARRAAGGEVPA